MMMTTMNKHKSEKKKHVSRRLRRFPKANEAVSALEYAILVGVIAVGIAAALAAFESNIEKALKTIGDKIGATTHGTTIDADG